ELTKFGFSETFYVFREFETISAAELRSFSASAIAIAKLSKTIPLPCGLFECVSCFAVAVAGQVEAGVAESVRQGMPTKHFAAFEIPVLFNRSNGQLSYLEKTPIWGCAYYSGFRSQIARYLGHAAAA
ncbi:MAG TPA: hypothetical protein VMF30_20010, partial [Pirellulales bacterium]|nr:hypothetical protein [Pirellulales bacterium]